MKTYERELHFLFSIWYFELKQSYCQDQKTAPCDHLCQIEYSRKSIIIMTGSNFIFIRRVTNRTLKKFLRMTGDLL